MALAAEDRAGAGTARPELRVRRVLCASDFSSSGVASLGEANLLARLFGAELVVVAVNLAHEDRARLEHDARRLAAGHRPGIHLVSVGGDPAAPAAAAEP